MEKKKRSESSVCQEGIRETYSLSAQACYRSLDLVRLWQEGRVREMRNVSLGADFLHPVVLELHAKASYIVLQEEGRLATPEEIRHFIDCWLSFLFHPVLFRSLPEKLEEPEQYRLELLEAGANMVRKYAEQQGDSGEQFIRQWAEDSAVLKALSGAETKDRKDVLLYTPALARQAGISGRVVRLIRENEDAFPDQEDFLFAGALYSRIDPALLLVRQRQYDTAKEKLASLKKRHEKKSSDPFVAYGLAQVNIACGLDSLEQGRYEEAEKTLSELLPLPQHSSGLEQKLLVAFEREDKYLDPDWLAVGVHVLSELQKYCSTQAVKKALCSVLTHQAVLLHNIGAIDAKVLLTSMEKAVRLNPDDEFTRMTFDDARMDAEIHSLHQSMSIGQLAEASRIAKKSSYPEVVDQFFLFVAQVIEQVEAGDYPDDTSAFLMLQQLLEGALNVNPEHPMIREVALLLDDLEDSLED